MCLETKASSLLVEKWTLGRRFKSQIMTDKHSSSLFKSLHSLSKSQRR